MRLFNYYNPVKIYYAPSNLIPTLTDTVGPEWGQKVTLIYGQRSMEAAGVISAIKDGLQHCEISEIGGIRPNPSLGDINCLQKIKPEDEEWVIGIGGGSVLDSAKIYSAPTSRHLIAIPTTSGTGSEVTYWATVWDFDSKVKWSLEPGYPEYAIIDPSLTFSLPAYETAYTGFDALSHALEAYWSAHSNPISDMQALKAIGLIFSNLYSACHYPDNIEYRSAMSLASLHAGLAFSNTKTTAVHAVSYPMTLRYGIPHGVACSLLLPSFWRYNLGDIDPNKVRNLCKQLDITGGHWLSYELDRLAVKAGLPRSLKAVDIPREGIEVIVEEGFCSNRMENNPRELMKADLRHLLEEIYE